MEPAAAGSVLARELFSKIIPMPGTPKKRPAGRRIFALGIILKALLLY
jgi:hypothetical protein